jgi:hypothetical protein
MTREAVDDIGGDRRGRNRVDADVLLGEFQGDTLGQPLDGVLGGAIDRGLGCADMSKGARRVDEIDKSLKRRGTDYVDPLRLDAGSPQPHLPRRGARDAAALSRRKSG